MSLRTALLMTLIVFSTSLCNPCLAFDDDVPPLLGPDPSDFLLKPKVTGGGDFSFNNPAWMKVIFPDGQGFYLRRYQQMDLSDTWENADGDEVDRCDPTAVAWLTEEECAKGQRGYRIDKVGLAKDHFGGGNRTYQFSVREDKNDGNGWRLTTMKVEMDCYAVKCWAVVGQDDVYRPVANKYKESLERQRDVQRVEAKAISEYSGRLPPQVTVGEKLSFYFEQRSSGSWDFSLDHESQFFSFRHTASGRFEFLSLLEQNAGSTNLNIPSDVQDPDFPKSTLLHWIYGATDASELSAHIDSFPSPSPFWFIPWTEDELYDTFRDYL